MSYLTDGMILALIGYAIAFFITLGFFIGRAVGIYISRKFFNIF